MHMLWLERLKHTAGLRRWKCMRCICSKASRLPWRQAPAPATHCLEQINGWKRNILLLFAKCSLMHTADQTLTRVPKQPHAHSAFSPLCHWQTRGFNHQLTPSQTCKNLLRRGLGTALHYAVSGSASPWFCRHQGMKTLTTRVLLPLSCL